MMIFLIYATVIILAVYIAFTFTKRASHVTKNPHANLEASPDLIPVPAYRPFKDGPFQMTMGLQSLNTHEWIQIDLNYRQRIQLKRQLLTGDRRKDIFICKDEAYYACMEVLKMLIEYLPYQYPNMFQCNSSKTKIINHITGETFDCLKLNNQHPLEIAAYLIQEDLVIMQKHPDEEKYYANALAVCFPSSWLPRSKFGLPLASVHIPQVPFFQEKLMASMDRYFHKLKEDNPVQRQNWSLQVGDNLCDTDTVTEKNDLITRDNAGQLMYLRVERQTLRRLPETKSILFTIKTYMTKFEDVCRNDPNTARRLASAIRNWPPEMVQYKGANSYKHEILAYLDIMSSID